MGVTLVSSLNRSLCSGESESMNESALPMANVSVILKAGRPAAVRQSSVTRSEAGRVSLTDSCAARPRGVHLTLLGRHYRCSGMRRKHVLLRKPRGRKKAPLPTGQHLGGKLRRRCPPAADGGGGHDGADCHFLVSRHRNSRFITDRYAQVAWPRATPSSSLAVGGLLVAS